MNPPIVLVTDTDGYVEGDKRQYIPAIIEWKCPQCGEQHVRNYYNDYYLSYPKIAGATQDKPLEIEETFYCDTCEEAGRDCEFDVKMQVRLQLSMEVVNVEIA